MFIFPRLAIRFGYIAIFKYGTLLLLATTIIMPFISILAPESYAADSHLPDFCQGDYLNFPDKPLIEAESLLSLYNTTLCEGFIASIKDEKVIIVPGQSTALSWWLVMINYACM